MRIGLLSDVHANLFALRSAISRLRAEGVDAWVCAGDLVGYGPHPNECVETIAELGATCVVGNHDSASRAWGWPCRKPGSPWSTSTVRRCVFRRALRRRGDPGRAADPTASPRRGPHP